VGKQTHVAHGWICGIVRIGKFGQAMDRFCSIFDADSIRHGPNLRYAAAGDDHGGCVDRFHVQASDGLGGASRLSLMGCIFSDSPVVVVPQVGVGGLRVRSRTPEPEQILERKLIVILDLIDLAEQPGRGLS
jgi:hypothetical protein